MPQNRWLNYQTRNNLSIIKSRVQSQVSADIGLKLSLENSRYSKGKEKQRGRESVLNNDESLEEAGTIGKGSIVTEVLGDPEVALEQCREIAADLGSEGREPEKP